MLQEYSMVILGILSTHNYIYCKFEQIFNAGLL